MQLKQEVSLAALTSLKVGGTAPYFIEVANIEDLHAALSFAKEKSLPIFILGGGTNVFFSELRFEGLVIAMRMRAMALEGDLLIAECGLMLPTINEFAFKNGLVGFHDIATVPGTLGGALYSNAHWKNH